jgi:hypothetical protein
MREPMHYVSAHLRKILTNSAHPLLSDKRMLSDTITPITVLQLENLANAFLDRLQVLG